MPKGLFIAIDGTDGSGKTVQTKKLVERIQQTGTAVDMLDFPRYGNPAAWALEKYLRGEYGSSSDVGAYRASIFFAIDRHDDSPRIRALLEGGTTLVTNRYVTGNKGHQTAHIDDVDEQKKFLSWLNELEYGIFGIPKPDITILLHVPADIAFRLVQARDAEGVKAGGSTDILQQLEHLKKAEAAYRSLPDLDDAENWRLIECAENDAILPINEIHERIWRVVEPLLGQKIS